MQQISYNNLYLYLIDYDTMHISLIYHIIMHTSLYIHHYNWGVCFGVGHNQLPILSTSRSMRSGLIAQASMQL